MNEQHAKRLDDYADRQEAMINRAAYDGGSLGGPQPDQDMIASCRAGAAALRALLAQPPAQGEPVHECPACHQQIQTMVCLKNHRTFVAEAWCPASGMNLARYLPALPTRDKETRR